MAWYLEEVMELDASNDAGWLAKAGTKLGTIDRTRKGQNDAINAKKGGKSAIVSY